MNPSPSLADGKSTLLRRSEVRLILKDTSGDLNSYADKKQTAEQFFVLYWVAGVSKNNTNRKQ